MTGYQKLQNHKTRQTKRCNKTKTDKMRQNHKTWFNKVAREMPVLDKWPQNKGTGGLYKLKVNGEQVDTIRAGREQVDTIRVGRLIRYGWKHTWDGQVKSQLTNTSRKGFQNKSRETRHYKTNKWAHDRKFRTWQTANHRPPTRCPSRPVLSHQVTSPPHSVLILSFHFSHSLFSSVQCSFFL